MSITVDFLRRLVVPDIGAPHEEQLCFSRYVDCSTSVSTSDMAS